MIEVYRNVIKARDGVLGQNYCREITCDKMCGNRVFIRAHITHREPGFDLAGYARFLQTHNALLGFAHT